MPTLKLVCYAPQSGRRHKPRSAKLLIDQHGEDAARHAAMCANTFLEAGDMEGGRVWLNIVDAIKELQRTRPRRDEANH